MEYYLGVDIGTSSVKAVAYTDRGEMLDRYSVSYPMQHPAPGYSEHDPDLIMRAVYDCIHRLVAALAPAQPLLLAFSAAMHSVLAVDEEGQALTPCMIWADNRAGSIAEALRHTPEGMEFYRRTGVPVHAMTPFSKLLWLRQYEPEIFQRAAKFVGIKEYVYHRLFGDWVVDTAIASATGLLNIRSLEWDRPILDYLSVAARQLSTVVPVGYTINYVAGQLALPLAPGTPVIIGGSDGASANLATGATGEQAMAITIGTSGAARMVISGVETDAEMRTFCYHVQGDCYILGGATNNGAVVLQWLKESLLQTSETYEGLLSLAGTVEPGADGLLFVPYILGERAPVWNSKARGVFFGLDIRHTKAHLIRAAMEGILFSLYSIARVLASGRDVTELHATGGFARSSLWLQMLADVFNIRVLAFEEEEGSALGAVLIGIGATGKGRGFAREAFEIYEPDAVIHNRYHQAFSRFERIYALVKTEFT